MNRYKVTQAFMDALTNWENINNLNTTFIIGDDIDIFPDAVRRWWLNSVVSNYKERNERLIAIIQWLNGEDVFEVEEPHKFVVRSEKKDRDGDYWYIEINNFYGPNFMTGTCDARKVLFNTREEAEKCCVPGYEVIEIDADGNEVE